MYTLLTQSGQRHAISQTEICMYGMLQDMTEEITECVVGNEESDINVLNYPDDCYRMIVHLTRHYISSEPSANNQDKRDERYARTYSPFDSFESEIYKMLRDKAHICLLYDTAKYLDNKAAMKFAARAYLQYEILAKAIMMCSSLVSTK